MTDDTVSCATLQERDRQTDEGTSQHSIKHLYQAATLTRNQGDEKEEEEKRV